MPRDGSGVYVLPSGNPVVTNTVIASTWANSTLSDIAAQLNNVLTRDGLLGPTGPFKLQDGTVNAPGLAFASEPGLGFYRVGAGAIGWATQGAKVIGWDFSTATATNMGLVPRAAGASSFSLSSAPAGAANSNALSINQNANGSATITTVAAGTATRGNLTLDATILVMTATANMLAPLRRT